MKKILLSIVTLFGLLLVLGFIWIFSSDGSFDVSRKIHIKAEKELVFEQVAELKKYVKWMPWGMQDSSVKYIFSPRTMGVSASYTWEGENIGSGKLTTININDNSSLVNKIEFYKPYESESEGYWKFENDEKGTKVTWGLRGKEEGIKGKFISRLIEKTIGDDLAKGLRNLKDTVESMKSLRYSTPFEAYIILEQEDQIFYGLDLKNNSHSYSDISIYRDGLTKLNDSLSNISLKQGEDYVPTIIYENSVEENKFKIKYTAAAYLKDEVSLDEKFVKLKVPGGRVLKFKFKGSYDELKNAHISINKYLKENNLKQRNYIFEHIISDDRESSMGSLDAVIIYQIE